MIDKMARSRRSLGVNQLEAILSRIEVKKFRQQNIRVIDQDGKKWVVFSDICKVFGYVNPGHQLKYVAPEEIRKIDIGLKNTLANCVSQKAIVSMAMISSRSIASDFRKWADEEVFGYS